MKNYCIKLVALTLMMVQVFVATNVLAIGPDPSKPYILITPYLSSTVLTNNQTVAVKANVNSNFPITKGYAKVEGFNFQIPLSLKSGTNKSGFWIGLWQTSGLSDKEYTMEVTFVDSTGHSWTDRSVTFTDPIAGNDLAGDDSVIKSFNNQIISQEINFDEDIENINSVKIYIRNSEGLFRVGLYDESKNLIWQSDVIQNVYENEWVEIPITKGSPNLLINLDGRKYFIAAQSILTDNIFGLEFDENSKLYTQRYLFNAFAQHIEVERIENYKLSAYVIYNEQFRFMKKMINSFLSWFE